MTQDMSKTVISKKQLRKYLASSLAKLSQDQLIHQSNNVFNVLRSLEIYQNSKKIAFYMNMDFSEVKTLPLIHHAFSNNKEVYLPHCTTISNEAEKQYPAQTSKLTFYRLESFQDVLDLKPHGKYKLKEPTSGLDLMSTDDGLDLIVLPAMGYTKEGYRLGHGAGFYDDYIKRHELKFHKRPFLLGVGLQEQLLEDIPVEDHDERLDGVIINKSLYGANLA